MTPIRMAAVALAALLLGGCDDDTYTLYRNAVNFSDMRIHVATFDATEGNKYNSENRQIARDLFANSQE